MFLAVVAVVNDVTSSRIQIAAVSACGVILLCSPLGYVQLTPLWRTVYYGAVIATVFLSAVFGAGTSKGIAGPLAALAVLVGVASTGSSPVIILKFLIPLFTGMFLAVALKGRLEALMFSTAAVGLLALGYEYLSGTTGVAEFFGPSLRPFFDPTDPTLFRARGLVGQPIPSAVIVIVCGLFLALRYSGNGLSFPGFATVGALAVIFSGTRSAGILCSFGLLLLFVVVKRSQIPVLRSHVPVRALALGASVAGVALFWPRLQSQFGSNRAFDYSSLRGSDSLSNRQHAVTVLSDWTRECLGPCLISGAGPRDLQAHLQSGLGISGLSTVDNLYITTLWDFGIVGLVLLLLVLGFLVRQFFTVRVSPVACRAAAGAALMILVAGVFFDSIYTPAMASLFGLLVVRVGQDSRSRRFLTAVTMVPSNELDDGLIPPVEGLDAK